MRFFNTAGPVNPARHYCLPPLLRFDLDDILSLIDQQKYFVLHAPRQTGKTTCLLALMQRLNESGEYRALYANIEAAQAARENIAQGMTSVVMSIASRASDMLGDHEAEAMGLAALASDPGTALAAFLSRWSALSAKPTVMLLDEVDSLVGDTLISLLRQLRSGYDKRPAQFPQTIILCGVRDVRDYRMQSPDGKAVITGGSAFNIKAESLRLGDFNLSDIETLYEQHTTETGQVFEPNAIDAAWDLTHGQPWLVNALAYETCFRTKENRDRAIPITAEMMETASENLILRRETHLDQLADKLKEPRVQRVIEPLLAGEDLGQNATEEDIQYVIDLGLVRMQDRTLHISNAIYREVIPRQLIHVTQISLGSRVPEGWYIRKDGSLDMDSLMKGFQEFFRENSEHWSQRFEYQEAWPQLLLQAFLQRVVNGGGQIHREYGLGRGRTDLLVIWPGPGAPTGLPKQRIVLELKVVGGEQWKRSVKTTLREGLEQTAAYLDRCGAGEGHLILFDRTAGKPWEEKIFIQDESTAAGMIRVWGM